MENFSQRCLGLNNRWGKGPITSHVDTERFKPKLVHKHVCSAIGGNNLNAGINGSEKRGFTILVAEDNSIDVYFLREAYAKAGLPHALHIVHDGEQAMNYLQGEAPFSDRSQFPFPDLFLLDLKMPRRDGFDVLRWMRHMELHQPPVLVLSGSGLEVDRKRCLELGAREYHVKTSSILAMVEFLQQISDRWLK